MGGYQVRVENIQFAAGHFATFGGKCERLHGHNYEVAAQIDGVLTDDSWVVDFTRLKAILRNLSEELDHRFILQVESRVLRITRSDESWTMVTPAGATYVFPAGDVVALTIDNSTAERLAQWFCGRLLEALGKRRSRNIEAVTVEVWEGPGQRASFMHRRLPQE